MKTPAALSTFLGAVFWKLLGSGMLLGIRWLARGHFDWPDVLMCLLVGCCVDYSRPLLLKNYYFLYLFFLFGVGGGFFFPDQADLQLDFILFLVAFALGYSLIFVSGRPARAQSFPRPWLPVLSFQALVWLTVAFKLVGVVYNIRTYGVGGYIAGDAMLDNIRSYGSKDVGRGILTLFSEAARILTMAAVCLHIRTQNRLRSPYRYRLLALLLVVLPLVSMERTFTVWGVMIMGVLYSFEHYPQGQFRRRDYLIFSLLATFFLGFILLIGSIRVRNMTQGEGSYNDALFLVHAVTGEFQNVLVYQKVKDEIASRNLHYTYGETIVGPLVFKIIPRAFYPGKPINSGATISKLLEPQAFEEGFMYPAAYFGDLYLNFGLLGCIAGCLVLGSVCRFLDFNYINKNSRFLPHFVVFYYYFYPIVRNDISNSVSVLIFVAVTVWVLERFMKPASAPLPVAPAATPTPQPA